MAIVALTRHFQFQTEAIDAQVPRTGQGQAAVGGVGGVVQIERLAIAVARGDALDLVGQHAGDIDGVVQAILGEFDRLVLQAAKITDQIIPDAPWNTPCLAGDDGPQGCPLPIFGADINDAGKNPAAVRHDPARADNQGEL